MLRQTRTEEDFLENFQKVVRIDLDAEWRLVTDNLNTRVGESLVRYVTEVCNVDVDLGVNKHDLVLAVFLSRKARKVPDIRCRIVG